MRYCIRWRNIFAQLDMMNTLIKNLGIVLLSVVMASCGKMKDEEIACKVAKDFAEAFCNLEPKKAKQYCHRDLYPIMNFRNASLRPRDRAFLEASGKVDVRMIKYEMDSDIMMSVDMEVLNMLKIDYMTDSLSICPCDTMSLILTNYGRGKWYVTDFH